MGTTVSYNKNSMEKCVLALSLHDVHSWYLLSEGQLPFVSLLVFLSPMTNR